MHLPHTILLTCFYEMLLPSLSLLLFHFSTRVDFAVGSFQACVAQCWCMFDADCHLHRGEVGERERITQGTFPQETPPSLLSPSAYVGGLTFPSPSLRNNQLLLFYIVVFFLSLSFCCCSDETFFLMLKLLLVFCDGCSALSFLLSRMSLGRGWEEDERWRFGWSSRVVVPNLGGLG